MKSRILIVDDDGNFVRKLKDAFESKYNVEYAFSVNEFYEKFKPYYFDLILLDIKLPRDKEGLDILKLIKEENPLVPVIMVTAYPDVDSAIQALKIGARDYIQKEKVDIPSLVKMVDSVISETGKEKRVKDLEKMLTYFSEPLEIVGKSDAIKEIKEKIKIAAEDGEITVLIRGETGVGKELVARNIHAQGVRKKGPFIAYLIAGAHKETMDSELFGHERGAFTGATEKRKGLLEEAHGGILFLDEIGDLPEEIQIKLLRVMETKSFRRLGGNMEIVVDVQFIAATHKNLEELIKKDIFRKDLYYRLKAFEIYIPPLRDRKEDIPILVEYFLNLFRKRKGIEIEGVTKEAMDLLVSYNWPGNVRELKNVIENSIILAKAKGIKLITPDVISVKGLELKVQSAELRAQTSSGNIRHSPLTVKIEEVNEEMNFEKVTAVAELEFVKKGIEKYGKKREVLAQKLGYSNRFTFIRRIRRIFKKFPELKKEFPEIAKVFKI